jgi:hypothetical protein
VDGGVGGVDTVGDPLNTFSNVGAFDGNLISDTFKLPLNASTPNFPELAESFLKNSSPKFICSLEKLRLDPKLIFAKFILCPSIFYFKLDRLRDQNSIGWR